MTRIEVSFSVEVQPGARVRRWRWLPWPTRHVDPSGYGVDLFRTVGRSVDAALARQGYSVNRIDGDSRASIVVSSGW